LKTSGKHMHEAHSEHKKHEAKTAEHVAEKKDDKAIENKMPGGSYLIISAVIIVILLAAVIYLLVRKPMSGPATPAGEKVKVEFYVMSQCPYGTQVENEIAPVLKSMGDAVDFHLDFIVQETSPGVFQSMHGEKEVKGDIVQLCAMKYYSDDYKYMDFILCQNKNAASVDTNWVSCAQENGMDANKLKTCLEGEEGKTLLRTSLQKTTDRQARGSPTMYIADSPYQGQRDSASFQRAICQSSTSSACTNLPKCSSDADCTEQEDKEGYCINPGEKNAACEYREPVKVNLLVLNDKRCVACATGMAQLIPQLKSLFLGLEVKEIDYSSTEGKTLYKSLGITHLPAVLFDNDVVNSKSYTRVSNYLAPAGQYLSLAIGADFDPTAEICDNNIDDNDNGKTDCDDESCKSQWMCMEKKDKPEVELFVMSHCPYGTQIEKGFIPVVEALGNKINFTVKFCDYAMHGEKELDEELQQYCIQKEQNSKFIDYLKCFLKEGKSDECMTSVGIDKAKLSACITVADDTYKVTKNFEDKTTWNGNFPTFNIFKTEVDQYDVQGSPTLVINGVVASSARDPANLLDAVCTGFKVKPAECNVELSSESPTPGFGFETTTTNTAVAGCGV